MIDDIPDVGELLVRASIYWGPEVHMGDMVAVVDVDPRPTTIALTFIKSDGTIVGGNEVFEYDHGAFIPERFWSYWKRCGDD